MAEAARRARIACLAWGSLIWKSAPLRLRTAWAEDGPSLPIEFCRVGDHGELATTIREHAALVPTRWAVLDVASLAEARELLRRREEIDTAHPEWVGALPALDRAATEPPFADEIRIWAKRQQLEGVVWTALPPRFDGREGRAPTAAEAVAYLRSLRGATRDHAHDYIRRVPVEIRTPYRAEFEAELGLTPRS